MKENDFLFSWSHTTRPCLIPYKRHVGRVFWEYIQKVFLFCKLYYCSVSGKYIGMFYDV